jgi:hypothetical protein
MKTQKIQGKEYQIPENWYDINLNKFLKMKDLEIQMSEMDESDYTLEYINIISDIPKEDLLNFEISEIGQLLVDLEQFGKSEIPVIDTVTAEVNGIKYVQEKRTETYSLGLFTDLETILKSDPDFWNNAHKITACFLRRLNLSKVDKAKLAIKNKFKRPIKLKDYKVAKYDYKVRVQDEELFYEHLPMPYIYSCVVFFLTFANSLLQTTKDYSQPVQ